MAAADCGSALPLYDKLRLLSSRSFKIKALSYSKSVIIPIFFLAYSSDSFCFASNSTPDMRGRAWYRDVSSGFDLSDDFWDAYDMLDFCLEIVLLLLFFFRSAETLEMRTRPILLLFPISSSSEFALPRESAEHRDLDCLRRTDPLILPEAGLTGLRLCVLSLPA